MTLEQVISNVERLIQGKRAFQLDMQAFAKNRNTFVLNGNEMLQKSVDELNRILQDLSKVQTAQQAEQAEGSWEKNPDRMSGCYTSQEIAASRGWQVFTKEP